MKNLKWQVLMDDTDYLCASKTPGSGRSYVFVEVADMDAACGQDNEGKPPYYLAVVLVDLDAIGSEQIRSALENSGWDGDDWSGTPGGYSFAEWQALSFERRKAIRDRLPLPENELAIAEACFRNGNKAPLYWKESKGQKKLIAEGRREARRLVNDADELEDRMSRTVNRIGSTAKEFMQGDITPALYRGVMAGDVMAQTLAKMHGVSDEVLDQAANQRPRDWLPYMSGYLDGLGGREKATAEGQGFGAKVAPEYHQGYDRGVAVKAGLAVAPTWVKGPNQKAGVP